MLRLWDDVLKVVASVAGPGAVAILVTRESTRASTSPTSEYSSGRPAARLKTDLAPNGRARAAKVYFLLNHELRAVPQTIRCCLIDV